MSARVDETSRPRRLPARLIAGAAILVIIVALSLLSLVWTPVEAPTRLRIALRLAAPGDGGLLGADQLGRDVLSLLMIAARHSLAIAALSVATGAAMGIAIGLAAAALSGRLAGHAIMRAMDVVFAFPPILSAMMLAALLGTGFVNAVVAIAVFVTPVFARVARAGALRVLARDYVLAARGAGKGPVRIAAEHVLPNISGDLAVQASIQFGLAILTEAGLSFLGLGLAPPAPSWGRMLAESQTFLSAAPWLALAPGLAIAITVTGANLFGDGLRDHLDTRDER
ncbi:ABC transporter permease [Aureimonas mangrovi]|uniref:ABC transporter permease n=1 Tax=Aureimonas mangrovi TaxID=2758041 RepID=UPI00163DB04B|nr:ABC transporter permease [Aureimonas mangrovi]